jgi:DNA-binding NarL/FixJ family response regulator
MNVARPRAPELDRSPDDAQLRVAIACADELLRRRISGVLAAGGMVVAARACDAARIGQELPGLAAIVLGGMTAAPAQRAAVRSLLCAYPEVPVVVVRSPDGNGVRKALMSGARAVVAEDSLEAALLPAIHAVRADHVVVPRDFHRHAVRPPLSHREKEALALVATGLTNREIAARLCVSENTVKTHLASAFGKLGVRSRLEASALVLDPDAKLGVSVAEPAGRSRRR